MPRYRLTVAYDGTDFCGWQKQEPFVPEADDRPEDQRTPRPGPDKLAAALRLGTREGESRARVALRTVQAVVEQAVREVVREPIVLQGASRTDAGVHAKGQVCAFTCAAEAWPSDRGLDRLVRALNGKLPDDVLVSAAVETTPDFDPVRGAVSKAYSYTLHVSPPPPLGAGLRPLWDRRYVHHVWEPLDVGAMREAASHLVGEHDFAAFAASGHGRLTTVRTVHTCEVRAEAPMRVRIDISGSGFLWNMVRIVAGTLVDVGRGRKKAADVPAILASRNRGLAGPTLPPTGLCLEWIRYE